MDPNYRKNSQNSDDSDSSNEYSGFTQGFNRSEARRFMKSQKDKQSLKESFDISVVTMNSQHNYAYEINPFDQQCQSDFFVSTPLTERV